MNKEQSAYSRRMWTVLKFVPAFCVALLVIGGCDGSNSSPVGISAPVGISTEWNEEGYKIRRLTDNTGIDESPSWSPNGRSIAFASSRGKENTEIYVMDVDGDNLRRLTNHTSQDGHPSWSPDGHSIAFFSNRDDNEDIYVMDASGDNLRNLTNHSAWDGGPSWSPDGRSIAFSSERDGNEEIYVMDVDGGNVRRLTNHTSQDASPSWSPDGRSIAFFSLRDDDPETAEINPEIYVMDADGGNVRRLTSHIAWDFAPSWSPDSRFIVFYSNRDDNRDVYVIEGFGE